MGVPKQPLEAQTLEIWTQTVANATPDNRWLLVIDDVKDPAAAQTLWARLPTRLGHVLVTSSKAPAEWEAAQLAFSHTHVLEAWSDADLLSYWQVAPPALAAAAAALDGDAAQQRQTEHGRGPAGGGWSNERVSAMGERLGRLPLPWRMMAGVVVTLSSTQARAPARWVCVSLSKGLSHTHTR
jgi:hypothetical protein